MLRKVSIFSCKLVIMNRKINNYNNTKTNKHTNNNSHQEDGLKMDFYVLKMSQVLLDILFNRQTGFFSFSQRQREINNTGITVLQAFC